MKCEWLQCLLYSAFLSWVFVLQVAMSGYQLNSCVEYRIWDSPDLGKKNLSSHL